MKVSRRWAPFALAALAACSAEPRATAFFAAHPAEAARVVKACGAGTHRGVECQNAEAALAALKRDARMARYKKAFE
jgi:hypothetical protein